MHPILSAALAVSALLSACDRAMGNRLGLGARFEEALRMLGPLSLSMAGLLCLSPLLSALCRPLSPLLTRLGADPALPACLLAIDMGGWQVAEALAESAASARFFGILAASTLGCTLSFTIPAGMGLYEEETRRPFCRGLLFGLVTAPAGLFAGALFLGIPALQALCLCLPLILLSALLAAALLLRPGATILALRGYAAALRVLGTLGLGLGAFQSLSGWQLLPGMMPLSEALSVVCAIGITLLGAMPLSDLLLRALSPAADALGRRLGLSARSIVGMLMLFVSVTPGLGAIPEMEDRGKTAAAAFAVSGASCLTAHLAFASQFAPETAGALAVCKAVGALSAAALALLAMNRETPA